MLQFSVLFPKFKEKLNCHNWNLDLIWEDNWVLTTNSNFLISTSLQPYAVNFWSFKLRLFDLTEFIVWNINVNDIGLQIPMIITSVFCLWQELMVLRNFLYLEVLQCTLYILHFILNKQLCVGCIGGQNTKCTKFEIVTKTLFIHINLF